MTKKAEAAVLGLLERRGVGKTICPSEAARVLAADTDDWRSHIESVHMAVDAMLESGAITLTWKGKKQGQRRGAYRIAPLAC
jgi:hypothetical protein